MAWTLGLVPSTILSLGADPAGAMVGADHGLALVLLLRPVRLEHDDT